MEQNDDNPKVQFSEEDIGKKAMKVKIDDTADKIVLHMLAELNIPTNTVKDTLSKNPPMFMPLETTTTIITAAANALAYITTLISEDDHVGIGTEYARSLYSQFLVDMKRYAEQAKDMEKSGGTH